VLRSATLTILAATALAYPAAAQKADPAAKTPVGQGNEYRTAPPFPSQRDGQLWMRRITVIDPQTGQRAELNVLSNDPVPNPGNVPSAQGAASDSAARVGQGSAYANAPPFPSQRDEVFLVRQMTLVDPVTGAAQTVRILSNTPVPNPGDVPRTKPSK
jgi:hypothetical protein